LVFCGSPVSLKYCLASFHAVSTASLPPVVKKTRSRSPGAAAASRWELDGRRVGVGPQREEGQLLRLSRGRLGQHPATVSGLDDEQPGQAVEVASAAVVEDLRSPAADDHGRRGVPVGAHPGEVQPEVGGGVHADGRTRRCDVLLGGGHGCGSRRRHRPWLLES